MPSVLRGNWQRRLDAAQLDPAWSAQIEARVLRFLLSRYEGASQESPVPIQPFYRGEEPHGRAKVPLSPRAQRGRLEDVARGNIEAHAAPVINSFSDWLVDEAAYRDARRRQSRNQRGYW